MDPVLGRIVFANRNASKHGVSISYHYGFSMDMGGGEYERIVEQPEKVKIYQVGKDAITSINKAIEQWQNDLSCHAVIEITDSNVYDEKISIEFQEGQKSLQLRAGNRCRPVIRLTDRHPDRPDAFTVIGAECSRFTLDGVLIFGRSLQIDGDLAELTIRHSTLVPDWTVEQPQFTEHNTNLTNPILEIFSPKVSVFIEHSILGQIQVNPFLPEPDSWDEKNEQNGAKDEMIQARCQGIGREVRLDPIKITVHDSILDATAPEAEVIGGPDCPVAHAILTIVRSTVIGQIQAHAVVLGENSIFYGQMTVARRQIGCLRFCYVEPESRTPKRYRCQPDLVKEAISEHCPDKDEEKKEQEITRIRPRFNSLRYGTPTYCQLADDCAEEIKQGADDEAEMGVFHDLYQPQRMANLRVRLDKYLPARMDVGVIVSD
ncbi:MAG: hypothetical protein D3923_02740 [Candidatus Electrothrix sp. AR3]|nr:hypothetical protein [Candidatus Electrothrix sp. AR3]